MDYSQGMSRTVMSVEEYLHTSFPDLDREYWDGEIVERSLPDYKHSRMQLRIGARFEALGQKTPIFACSELRVRLRTNLILIPDICVFWQKEPASAVPEFPPLIAIEILSRDDRLTAAREKLELYRSWGVKHVWLVDPYSRRMYTCDAGLREVESLGVPELDFELKPEDIFDQTPQQ